MSAREPIPKPDAIFFDTNLIQALPEERILPEWLRLEQLCDFLHVRMLIPEICVRELIERKRQRLQKIANDFRSFGEEVPGLLEFPPARTFIDDIPGRAKRSTEDRLKKLDLEVAGIPYDELDEELIRMAVERIPPFEEGGKGFQDAIILQTICGMDWIREEVAPCSVILASKDTVFRKTDIAVRAAKRGRNLSVFESVDSVVRYLDEHKRDWMSNGVKFQASISLAMVWLWAKLQAKEKPEKALQLCFAGEAIAQALGIDPQNLASGIADFSGIDISGIDVSGMIEELRSRLELRKIMRAQEEGRTLTLKEALDLAQAD